MKTRGKCYSVLNVFVNTLRVLWSSASRRTVVWIDTLKDGQKRRTENQPTFITPRRSGRVARMEDDTTRRITEWRSLYNEVVIDHRSQDTENR